MATNNPGQPALPLLNPYLGWLPARYWRRVKLEFMYEVNFLSTSGGSVSTQLTFDADADFALLKQTRTIYATDLVTVIPSGQFTINIVDSSSGRARSNQSIHIDNAYGVGSQITDAPMVFPRVIPASTVWTITCTDLATGQKAVRLAFHGFKIYPMTESRT